MPVTVPATAGEVSFVTAPCSAEALFSPTRKPVTAAVAVGRSALTVTAKAVPAGPSLPAASTTRADRLCAALDRLGVVKLQAPPCPTSASPSRTVPSKTATRSPSTAPLAVPVSLRVWSLVTALVEGSAPVKVPPSASSITCWMTGAAAGARVSMVMSRVAGVLSLSAASRATTDSRSPPWPMAWSSAALSV